MAPKAAAADPAEAVTAAVAAADGCSGPAKAAALEPLIGLLADPEAQPLVLEQATAALTALAAVLDEAAGTPGADVTAELAQAVDTAAKLISAFGEAGAAAVVVATCAAPLAAIVAPAIAADASEPLCALLTSACAALAAVAASADGRLALRKASVVAPLLAIVQPPLAVMPSLQVQAALALSRLVESPTCRASLGVPATLPSLLALLPTLGTPPSAADAFGLRARSKLLLLLGFCLYDGALLPQLVAGGLVDAALSLLAPLAPSDEPEAEAPSEEAVQCAAELRSNAATVLAIGGQSMAGRKAIVAAGGLPALVEALSGPGVPSADAAALDAAASALIANLTLSLAHVALDGAAAATLASLPATLPALVAVLPPPAEGSVPGWAAVRGNACTALLHIVHQPSARAALLNPPPPPPAAAAEAAEGEEAAAETKEGGEEEAAAPAPSAVEVLVGLLVAGSPPDADADADADAAPPAAAETDVSLLATVADLVGQCASEAAGREVLMAAGCAAPLLRLLAESTPPLLLEAATAAYAALAAHPSACALLKGPSAPPAAPPAAEGDAEGEGAETKEGGGEEGEGAATAPPPPPPAPIAIVLPLLGGSSASLQRAGCALVDAACSDAESATKLIKLGALPLLQALTAMSASDGLLAAAARAAILSLCTAVPAALLWYRGELPPPLPTADGFYAVTRDSPLLAVEDLALSNDGPEVLLVDVPSDPALAALVTTATALQQAHADKGASAAELVSALARLVSEQLGGAVEYLAYELFVAPEEAVAALRAASGSRVVPLGDIGAGATRHRALLFKVSTASFIPLITTDYH